jgi:hypothetical protein
MNTPCPLCNTPTDLHSDCPGYPGRGSKTGFVMACNPPCGNACRFECPSCHWWYRTPNCRDASKMGIRPDWLDAVLAVFEEAENAL